MDEENRKNNALADFLKSQATKSIISFGFGTIGGSAAAVIIIISAAALLIVMSSIGLSSEGIGAISQQTPSQQSNSIYSWQSQITSALQAFSQRCDGDDFYVNNVMLGNIANGSYAATKRSGSACGIADPNTYYCTDLVIDSYNLAGIKNNFSEGVIQMIRQWNSISGLTVRQNNDVRGLIPGDAVFWLVTNDPGTANHVGLISRVDVDSQTGNGTIVTNDANTNKKNNTFYVRSFSLIGEWGDGANNPWFGLGPR